MGVVTPCTLVHQYQISNNRLPWIECSLRVLLYCRLNSTAPDLDERLHCGGDGGVCLGVPPRLHLRQALRMRRHNLVPGVLQPLARLRWRPSGVLLPRLQSIRHSLGTRASTHIVCWIGMNTP